MYIVEYIKSLTLLTTSLYINLVYPPTKLSYLVLAILICAFSQITAQTVSHRIDSALNSSSDNKLVVFPLIFYLPETSVGFGGAGALTYRWKNQSKLANPSQVQFVATYTLENQILLYAPFKLYFNENKYYVFGELGYYKYFYRYFGIGAKTTEEQEETYKANFPRFALNVTRQFSKRWFFGPSLWYDNFDMREFERTGELISGNTIGIEGGAVIGLGLRLIHDSRDNTFYPTRGSYGDISWISHHQSIGSNYNYHTLDIRFSHYLSISDKQILATNLTYREVSDEAPFYHLAQHGGTIARGYILGRYRHRSMFTVNIEWRQKIKGRFGVVVFGNYGGVSESLSSYNLSDLKPAIGLGLRYELDKINHLNVRLDYGIGQGSSEFYITVGEAF